MIKWGGSFASIAGPILSSITSRLTNSLLRARGKRVAVKRRGITTRIPIVFHSIIEPATYTLSSRNRYRAASNIQAPFILSSLSTPAASRRATSILLASPLYRSVPLRSLLFIGFSGQEWDSSRFSVAWIFSSLLLCCVFSFHRKGWLDRALSQSHRRFRHDEKGLHLNPLNRSVNGDLVRIQSSFR